MKPGHYQMTRILISLSITAIVITAFVINNFYLAISGILIGMLFLSLARRKFKKVIVDERVISISGKASRASHIIVTVFLAALGLFFIFSGGGNGDIYLESLGIVLCYVSLLLITIYSISYYYYTQTS